MAAATFPRLCGCIAQDLGNCLCTAWQFCVASSAALRRRGAAPCSPPLATSLSYTDVYYTAVTPWRSLSLSLSLSLYIYIYICVCVCVYVCVFLSLSLSLSLSLFVPLQLARWVNPEWSCDVTRGLPNLSAVGLFIDYDRLYGSVHTQQTMAQRCTAWSREIILKRRSLQWP